MPIEYVDRDDLDRDDLGPRRRSRTRKARPLWVAFENDEGTILGPAFGPFARVAIERDHLVVRCAGDATDTYLADRYDPETPRWHLRWYEGHPPESWSSFVVSADPIRQVCEECERRASDLNWRPSPHDSLWFVADAAALTAHLAERGLRPVYVRIGWLLGRIEERLHLPEVARLAGDIDRFQRDEADSAAADVFCHRDAVWVGGTPYMGGIRPDEIAALGDGRLVARLRIPGMGSPYYSGIDLLEVNGGALRPTGVEFRCGDAEWVEAHPELDLLWMHDEDDVETDDEDEDNDDFWDQDRVEIDVGWFGTGPIRLVRIGSRYFQDSDDYMEELVGARDDDEARAGFADWFATMREHHPGNVFYGDDYPPSDRWY